MADIKTDYTREELIALCEKAIIPQEQWEDRDSCEALSQIGKCWALLKAGCRFEIIKEAKRPNMGTITDEETIWVEVYARNFKYFEHSSDEDRDFPEDTFYIPTEQRLERSSGSDWY